MFLLCRCVVPDYLVSFYQVETAVRYLIMPRLLGIPSPPKSFLNVIEIGRLLS